MYYYCNDETKFIYYSEEFISDPDELRYIGESDNPRPKSAAAAFMQRGLVNKGYRLRRYRT